MTALAAVAAVRDWAAGRTLDFRHDEACGHGAVFSRCGRYRYLLWRDAVDERAILGIGMLNPSKADHLANDPTIAPLPCTGTGRGGFATGLEPLRLA